MDGVVREGICALVHAALQVLHLNVVRVWVGVARVMEYRNVSYGWCVHERQIVPQFSLIFELGNLSIACATR